MIRRNTSALINKIPILPDGSALYMQGKGWAGGGAYLEAIRHGLGDRFQCMELGNCLGKKQLVKLSHGISKLEKLHRQINDPALSAAIQSETKGLRTACKNALKRFSVLNGFNAVGSKFMQIMTSLMDAIVSRRDVYDAEKAAATT